MKFRLTKNLDPLRASALARLNDKAGEELYSLTASPVALLRARKLAEARAALAGLGDTPLLTAEAFDLSMEVSALAATILAKAAEEASLITAIETRRQSAQAAIRTAPNPAAIEAALEEFAHG